MIFRAFLASLVLAFAFAGPAAARSTLDSILPEIRADHPGRLSDAEPYTDSEGRTHYRIKWMTPEGRILYFNADAETGRYSSAGGDGGDGGRQWDGGRHGHDGDEGDSQSEGDSGGRRSHWNGDNGGGSDWHDRHDRGDGGRWNGGGDRDWRGGGDWHGQGGGGDRGGRGGWHGGDGRHHGNDN